jgi:hypothetical protein
MAFLREDWETLTTEELGRARGTFSAWISGLEEGSVREQLKSIYQPMVDIQDAILDVAILLTM